MQSFLPLHTPGAEIFSPQRGQECPRHTYTTILVRNHALDFGRVRVTYQHCVAQLLFAFVRFGGQHVAQMRMPALHFSGCSFLEALGCAFMCFQLWHKSSELAFSRHQRLTVALENLFGSVRP